MPKGVHVTTAVANPYAIPAATGRAVDFFTGHQDDEIVTLGKALAHHVYAEREANLILATDGSTTGARDVLNGQKASGWWGGTHDPEIEGYAELTPADIAAARDREYVGSGLQHGIPLERIHLNKEHRGPTLDVDQAMALIIRRREESPDAGIYTHHWDDIDDTHAALGTALKELHTRSPLDWADVRWMVRPEQVGEIPGAMPYGVPASYADKVRVLMTRAARCYAAWAPQQGRFAVGYHSVGLSLFPRIHETSYFVKP